MKTPSKISPHFFHHELFSKGMWQSHSNVFLRKLLDPRLIPILEKIRTDLNRTVSVNTWYWASNTAQYRGFRPFSTSIGARYSQHKMGRAVDLKIRGMTADEVRAFILDKESEFMHLGLTRLEDGRDAPTWTHLDLAWTGKDKIHVFRDR